VEPESAGASRNTSAPAHEAQEPSAFLLGNGRLAVLLTRTGAGFSAVRGRALTRWVPDPIRQLLGAFFYVRDVDGDDVWSAGFEPVARVPTLYDVRRESRDY
jgi:cyclic beta-1,2-glucan synthetase